MLVNPTVEIFDVAYTRFVTRWSNINADVYKWRIVLLRNNGSDFITERV